MYKCPWIGTFYADEYREEVRVSQQFQQLVVVGHVDRGLGRELERVVARLEPGREFRQECSGRRTRNFRFGIPSFDQHIYSSVYSSQWN